MVAVVDIGNHNIHYGFYHKGRLWSYTVYPRHELRSVIRLVRAIRKKRVTGCAIASVVPGATRSIRAAITKSTGIRPVMVSHKNAPDLRFAYRKPVTLGADRIANVVGGLARYRGNVIVVDCGTAVTLDIGLKNNHHLGGVIIPGMQAMIDGLKVNTTLLKGLKFERPGKLIGSSTKACVYSGVYYGTLFSIEGLIKAIKKDIKKTVMCIATGGWGSIVARECPSIDCYDRSLTLYGILKVYQHQVR